MMFSKKKRLLALVIWFLFLALVYWGFGNTALTMPITYAYYFLCLGLSVFYVLVCGGIRPLLAEDQKREEKSRKQYLRDKAKEHPIKRREKYRRFRIEKQEPKEIKELPPPPNIFRIPEEKRALLSQVLLVATIPFYLIFLLDWVYLYFFA